MLERKTLARRDEYFEDAMNCDSEEYEEGAYEFPYASIIRRGSSGMSVIEPLLSGRTITIGNKRRNDCEIYIGRPSPLGNPFVIGKDGDRATVIRKYEAWLAEPLKSNKSAASIELRRLAQQATQRDICLVCWCAPQPCHGDVIKRAIEQLLGFGR